MIARLGRRNVNHRTAFRANYLSFRRFPGTPRNPHKWSPPFRTISTEGARARQPDQARRCRPKATTPIEDGKRGLIIHVHPFDSAFTALRDRLVDYPAADSLTTEFWMDRRIQEKRVRSAIPREVDKTYQAIASKSADVCKASRQNRTEVARPVIRPGRRE